MLVSVSDALEKNSAVVGVVFYKCIRPRELTAFVRNQNFCDYCFCWGVLSIAEREMLKSPAAIVEFCIPSLVRFCFVYF